MNARDLIELLQQEDPDTEVHFAYDYGDRSHTMVAPTVTEVNVSTVKHSAYHEMDALVDEDDDEGSEEVRRVIVLS